MVLGGKSRRYRLDLPMSAMSVSPSRQLTIRCLLHGNSTIIPVKIVPDTLVGELKEIIKTKAPNSLTNVDAYQLTLYHVNVPNDVTITRDLDLLPFDGL
jgi:hypothetical protein